MKIYMIAASFLAVGFVTVTTTSSFAARAKGCHFYNKHFYKGESFFAKEGSMLAKLGGIGRADGGDGHNNKISSLWCEEQYDCKVTAFKDENFKGKKIVYWNVRTMKKDWDNSISSLKVYCPK